MFDSGVLCMDLIGEVRAEFENLTENDDAFYIRQLNEWLAVLYSDIIREQDETEADYASVLSLSDLSLPPDRGDLRREDIYAVCVGNEQLLRVQPVNRLWIPNSYCFLGNRLYINTKNRNEKIRIVYFVRPAPMLADTSATLPLPLEFVNLARYKLRAEACRRVNENALASAWINDYNYLLESFKAYIADRAVRFGV